MKLARTSKAARISSSLKGSVMAGNAIKGQPRPFLIICQRLRRRHEWSMETLLFPAARQDTFPMLSQCRFHQHASVLFTKKKYLLAPPAQSRNDSNVDQDAAPSYEMRNPTLMCSKAGAE